ncbi:fumarate hydratase, partial [Salmonella enterica subsp. enterica serovar Heidelberg str. N1514]
ARMDPFVEMMFQQGATAFLGKGDRADYVAELCKNTVGFRYSGLEERLQLIQNMLNQ